MAGGTGAIGRPLVTQLLDRGHEVVVLTRSAESAARLGVAGAEGIVGDALDQEGLVDVVAQIRPDVVVNQLTSLSRAAIGRSTKAGVARTARLRREASRSLVRAAESAGARRIIAQSISFAYRPGPGTRTETDPLYTEAGGAIAAVVEPLVDLENATLGSEKVEGVVLRYGTLYGPGTHFAIDGALAEMVRRRRLPFIGAARGTFGFVHVEDAASATIAALDSPPGTYNVVDHDPVTASRWIPYLVSLLGAKAPRKVPPSVARLAAGPFAVYLMDEQPPVSNQRALRQLGWVTRFDSWREGFRSTFDH